MTRQRRGLLTFIFSLMPGAGEMYMGFFKQGASIMLAFFGICAVASISGLSAIIIILPVIWFYSFFHVHNLASMPEENFCTLEDHIIFTEDEQLKMNLHSKKAQKIFAVILIVIGAFSLWDIFTDLLYSILPDAATNFVYRVSHAVPQCLIALLLIYLGMILIIGKKKELDEMPEAGQMAEIVKENKMNDMSEASQMADIVKENKMDDMSQVSSTDSGENKESTNETQA